MNSEKSSQSQCGTCVDDKPHGSSQRTIAHVAMRTMKIIVFFISFGMVYPHIFTEEE
jgi:hypothetical protein